VLDTKSNRSTPISITVPDEGLSRRPSHIPVSSFIESVGLSPKGERALFAARGDIFTAPIEKGPTRNLTHSSGAHDKWPAWSPDGTYIAFSVFRYSCHQGQFCDQLAAPFSSVMLLNTQTMQVTSVGTHQVQSLAWSPDGRKIAFAAFGTGTFGRGGLYVMDPDGSNLQFLGQSMGPYSVWGIAWSPDGARLALALDNENACPWYCDTALGVVKTDGTGLQVLANAHTSFPGQAADRYINFPAWSTDGSRLAYTVIGDCYESEPDCPTEIRVWDASRGDSYVLVPNAASGSWRP
jgi:Tol biopolymer transport system component